MYAFSIQQVFQTLESFENRLINISHRLVHLNIKPLCTMLNWNIQRNPKHMLCIPFPLVSLGFENKCVTKLGRFRSFLTNWQLIRRT